MESELTYSFALRAPEVIGNDYIVLGTVDKGVWKRGLEGSGIELRETLQHMADFKKVLELKVEPGGWFPISKGGEKRSYNNPRGG